MASRGSATSISFFACATSLLTLLSEGRSPVSLLSPTPKSFGQHARSLRERETLRHRTGAGQDLAPGQLAAQPSSRGWPSPEFESWRRRPATASRNDCSL